MNSSDTDKYNVLILAPTGRDALVLKETLANEGIVSDDCGTIEELARKIDAVSGTAIIAEEALSPKDIEFLVEAIKRQPEWSDFPFIIMSSVGADPDRAWAMLAPGAQSLNVNVLVRPVLTRTLLTAVQTALRSRKAQYRVARELARRKKAEASLMEANRELQAFSYSVSHDLKAPLRTIRGFSTFLLEDYKDQLDKTAQDYIDRIISGADNMGRLIDDMLSLSRVSRQEMTRIDVDMSELARTVVAELQHMDPDRQVDITIKNNLCAGGDPNLLKIALTNLLGNAWKYTLKTPGPRIEFGSFNKSGEEIFFVKDNGAGFPMEYKDRLFKPFQRLHSNKEFSGTGIGLPIVVRVINRHGGRIWAEAEEGRGATFFFTLEE